MSEDVRFLLKKMAGTCFSLQALALKFWRTSRGLIPKLGEQNLRKRGACQVSNLKHSVYLGNIGDEILPSYVGIIEINHYIMESKRVCSWLKRFYHSTPRLKRVFVINNILLVHHFGGTGIQPNYCKAFCP